MYVCMYVVFDRLQLLEKIEEIFREISDTWQFHVRSWEMFKSSSLTLDRYTGQKLSKNTYNILKNNAVMICKRTLDMFVPYPMPFTDSVLI